MSPLDSNPLLAALNPRASAVIEACAGAGKTWLLVSRIVRLLLAGAAPGQILAITFTRKAGEEMRTRLGDWLTEMATLPPARLGQFLRERGVTAGEMDRALAKAPALQTEVAAAAPGITVTTFDSWFYTLTRQAPLDAPLMRGEIATTQSRLNEAAWAALYAEARKTPQGALAASIDALLTHFGERKLHHFVREANQELLAWQQWVSAYAYGADTEGVVRGAEAMLGEALGTSSAGDLAVVDALLGKLATCFRHKGGEAQASEIAAARASVADGDIAAAAAFLLTDKGEPRIQIYRVATKYGHSQTHAQLLRALHAYQSASANAAVTQWHRHLYRVWHTWQEALATAKIAQGVMTFSDLTRNALTLTRDASLAQALAYKLDSRYKHVLIDELQDVNPAQWQVLTEWFNHASPADTTVFGVGDPKQCIYGFRGSNTALFARATADLERGFGAATYHADVTRRLAAPVAELVNHVFGSIIPMPVFRPHSALSGKPGCVWTLPLIERPANDAALASGERRDPFTTPNRRERQSLKAREATQIAEVIAHVVGGIEVMDSVGPRPARFSDVLVLVRAKSVMPEIEDALRTRQLPYSAVRLGGLVSRLEVRDFAALARFLVMPHDSLALAHVLRSPLFGVSDDDLVALARATQAAALPDELRPSWWQVLRQWHAAPLALAQATSQLARWMGWADTVPPHDLLSRVVSECGAHERYRQAAPAHLAAQAASNIDALLELALDIHGGEAPALITLANELEALAALPEQEAPAEGEAILGQDQVRIMTIHAAKGLEAPIVILADAHRPAPRQSHDHAVVVWPMGATAPTHFSWAIADTALGAKRQSWLDAARVRESIEECNLLYVAITRAAQFLIVTGHARVGADKEGHTSWYRAIERVVPATPQMQTPLATRASALPALAPLGTRAGAALMRREVGKRRQAPTASEAFGIAFHAWMDRLTRTPSHERQAVLAECADDELARALAATLAHPLAAPFFDADNILEARNEVELVAADGEILRPDRLVRTREAWWILDYKTGLAGDVVHPAITAQLASYAAALKPHAGAAPIYAAVITREGRVIEVPVSRATG